MRTVIGWVAAFAAVAALTLPATGHAGPATASGKSIKRGKQPRVELVTSMGTIRIELHADKAPKTVANFLEYAKAKHYDGTIFHRVIDGFMVQGGGFTPAFEQKRTRPSIQNEADNGLKNELGTVAMARTSDPHSATAQFFINVKDNGFLDHQSKGATGWGYCVFGKVVKGMDVVDKIKGVSTGARGPFSQDAPLKEVLIRKVRLL